MLTVRPLSQNDTPAFRELCTRYPMRLLTPRLNIEAHGFQGPIVRSWGAFYPGELELAGILLRYGNTAVGVDRDAAIIGYVKHIDGYDIAQATQWATTINDSAQRERAVESMVRRWMSERPTEAQIWLATAPVSEALRERWQKHSSETPQP